MLADQTSRTAQTRALPLSVQSSFWDDWNRTWRFRQLDSFMQCQRETATLTASRLGLRKARILDVGCGTGWLGNALLPFGRVWGVDLSEDAIDEGRRSHPGVELIAGDFLSLELPEQFDFVVSADSINNMYDPAAFVERIAHVLRPGGTLLLMTPNRAIWRHRSALKPLGAGQVQYWLSRAEYCALLRPSFDVRHIATIDPGGDRGLLWWVENRYVRGGMQRLVGQSRWRSLLEAAHLGRELVILAQRTTSFD